MLAKVLFPSPRRKNYPPGKLDLSYWGVGEAHPPSLSQSKVEPKATPMSQSPSQPWQLLAILFEACPMRDSGAGKASPLLFPLEGEGNVLPVQ